MRTALQTQCVLLFLTTASGILQVPLYVNVRERGYYDDINPSIKHYYDDEYYSVKDVKLGNPRKLLVSNSRFFFITTRWTSLVASTLARAYSLSLFNYEWRTAVLDRTFKQFKCPVIPGFKLRNITQRYDGKQKSLL